MRRHLPVLVVLIMLLSAVLSCGFPLPLGGTLSLLSVQVCAAEESADSCAARLAAYEAMAEMDSVSVTEFSAYLLLNSADQQMEMQASGRYDYAFVQSTTGPQPNVHIWLDEMVLTQDETETYNGAEIIFAGGEGYTLEGGATTWKHEVLDDSKRMGLSLILGMPLTAEVMPSFYSDPAVFTATTTIEKGAALQQGMQVHTLAVDLATLLNSPDVIGGLLAAGAQNSSFSAVDLGDSEQLTAMAPMFLTLMDGTVIETKVSIGSDGLIHAFEQTFSLKLDMTSVDPETAPMEMTYLLSGKFENFNGVGEIAPPAEFVESEGDGIFGGVGAPGS